MMFEPIPSVNPMETEHQNLSDMAPGCIYGNNEDTEILAKGQLIYLTLWENGTGRELAADHQVEMIDGKDGVLSFHGDRVQEFGWLLACWHQESLRPFFDALGLKVKEED